MPDFLIHRDVDVHAALRCQILVLQILRKRLQDADGQLVIQEAALDVPAFGDAAARVKADEIAHIDAELANILRRADILVQHDLHRVERARRGAVIAVDVDGRVAELHRAVNGAAELRNHAHVLRFGVVGVHAADIGDAQAAVALNLRDHAAERVRVGFQQQGVLRVFAAQINQHAALAGDFRVVPHLGELRLHILRRILRIPRRAVNPQQPHGIFQRKLRVLFLHN